MTKRPLLLVNAATMVAEGSKFELSHFHLRFLEQPRAIYVIALTSSPCVPR